MDWLKKTWHFIWEDNSIWSWIVNIILAYIVIKFILFPVLSLILGSTYPVVAVVSGSMEHDGNFDQWWHSNAACDGDVCTQATFYATHFNITEDAFKTFIFMDGFNKGDVMVLTSPKNIKVGDTIVYFSKDGRPIIHRVVKLSPLQTKGDHNAGQIVTPPLNELAVSQYQLIGKASLRIPLIGYVKIAFVQILSLFGIQVK